MKSEEFVRIETVGMSVKKKILVDEGVRDLARSLPELGIKRVSMPEDHDLKLGGPDKDIVRKLKKLATPRAGYLFITKNGKHFKSTIAKEFDVLIVDGINTLDIRFLLAFKSWLSNIGGEPTGTVYRARKSADKGTSGYVFQPIDRIRNRK